MCAYAPADCSVELTRTPVEELTRTVSEALVLTPTSGLMLKLIMMMM